MVLTFGHMVLTSNTICLGGEKFKFSQGSLKKAAHQTLELWKAALTKGLIPERYVLKGDFGGY